MFSHSAGRSVCQVGQESSEVGEEDRFEAGDDSMAFTVSYKSVMGLC